MWNILVVTIVMALAGYYAAAGPYANDAAGAGSAANATNFAEGMALYREAVVTYFSAHDLTNTSVSYPTLTGAGVVPAWSELATRTEPPIWANYRDGSGTIYIYPTVLPPVNIVPEILRLSQNSVLAGVYRAGHSTLQSPLFGDTGIPLALGGVPVPDGAPVWLAAARQ